MDGRRQGTEPQFCDLWHILLKYTFEIYFYDNLFNPNQASKIQNKKRLNKKTIEILLNEQFVLDNQQQNEAAIDRYVNEHAISVTRPTCR